MANCGIEEFCFYVVTLNGSELEFLAPEEFYFEVFSFESMHMHIELLADV